MSGHNKWSQIKHRKGTEDAKKSKIFGILAKQISVAVKQAGGDRNSALVKAAIEKARKANMPSDNIERAISRAAGEGGENFEQATYEVYGPAGVGIIIETISDNKNRTVNEIKHLLTEVGLSLAAPGSLSWAFERTRDVEGNLLWQAKSKLALSPEDKNKLSELLATLEEHEDVEAVYTNAQ